MRQSLREWAPLLGHQHKKVKGVHAESIYYGTHIETIFTGCFCKLLYKS